MTTGADIRIEALIQSGSINGRVYTDPAVFELEMERIFGRTWVFVAHESEIAQPGDYKATFIGLQPVIVTRGADDHGIHVLFNRCRHRAATVCQQEHGNAHAFRCAYHGWTYNNTGDLIGVPYREGYGEQFAYADHGLTAVARVDSYSGFIFASLSADGPNLVEHLGNARPFLDAIAGQGDAGIFVRTGAHKYGYDANWKLQLENTLDNYHVMFVHESFMALIGKRTGRKINMSNNTQWRSLYLGGGHGAIDFSSTGGVGASTFEDIPFNLVVFPNLAFVGVHIRTIRPISVDRTEVSLYPTLLNGGHDDVNAARLRKHEEFFGPSGFGAPDDVEVAMGRVRRGLNARGNDTLLLARGLHRETVTDDGISAGGITDEGHLRGLYSQWQKLLTSP